MTPADRVLLHEMHGTLQRVLVAVEGDGSPGSSLRERTSALEEFREEHRSSHRWSMARSIAMAAATAINTAVGLKVVVGL